MKTEDWKRLVAGMSDDVKALNQEVLDSLSGGAASAARPAGGTSIPVVPAALRGFALLWAQVAPEIELTTEYRFAPPRRWRFDFCHPETMVAIEYNGGAYSQGRHTRGRGYANDRDKVNTAQSMGWTVYELTTGQITFPRIEMIATTIKERLNNGNTSEHH